MDNVHHQGKNKGEINPELKQKNPVQNIDVATRAMTEEELPKVFAVMDQAPNTTEFILKGTASWLWL